MFSPIRNLFKKSTGDHSDSATAQVTSPSRPSELMALDFVSAMVQSRYSQEILDIPADAELALPDRVAAFRALENFIKTQDWQLSCTFIDVANSQEDSSECYFYGSKNDWLVLYIEYHYNINQWLIGAYETPTYTFSRPADESYNEYILRSIAEGQNSRMVYPKVIGNDGQYFISYS